MLYLISKNVPRALHTCLGGSLYCPPFVLPMYALCENDRKFWESVQLTVAHACLGRVAICNAVCRYCMYCWLYERKAWIILHTHSCWRRALLVLLASLSVVLVAWFCAGLSLRPQLPHCRFSDLHLLIIIGAFDLLYCLQRTFPSDYIRLSCTIWRS